MNAFKNVRAGQLLRYALLLIPLWLCARAKLDFMPFGFALGLYVALIYCRCNILLLTPVYLLACLLTDCSWCGLAYALAPALIMTAARFAHYKCAKPMKMLACNLYGALSLVPAIIACALTGTGLPFAALSWALVQIFTFFAVTACYALLVRGGAYRMGADETAGCVVLLAVVAAGLYAIAIYGVRPYYFAVGFAVVYALNALPSAGALIALFALGLGGGIAERSTEIVGGIVCVALIGGLFRKYSKWLTGAALVLADVLCGVYFRCFGVYDWWRFGLFAAGVLSYLILPKRVVALLPAYRTTDGSVGARNLITRTKSDLSGRLVGVARVFYAMADVYRGGGAQLPSPAQAVAPLAQELADKVCRDCERREECVRALGGAPAQVLESVVDSALRAGKATLVDLPNFVGSRCVRIPIMLAECNSLVASYNARADSGKTFEKDRAMMSAQLAGVGGILSDLSEEIKGAVAMEEKLQDKIKLELGYQNVVCSEAVVLTKKNRQEVSLVVRAEDANKKSVKGVLEQVLSARMIRADDVVALPDGGVCVRYETAPKYDVAYACAQRTKQGSRACGDTIAVSRLRAGKVLVGLCDGMGSGEDARKGSEYALQMIGDFYKAGFDNTRSLALINRLLANLGQENFSALDLCVVDLNGADADFVKLGGVQSYIARENGVQIIESRALPMGILEEASPQISRETLGVGDMAVIVSDGVSDALGSEGIRYILEKIGTLNPQAVCDELMAQAEHAGLQDDASAIVFRLFYDGE